MKYFILLLSLFITLSIANEAYSATCSSTSRTNYSTGQTLTSSALNADFNQLVSKVNSLDGGCVTDGTLEASALSATDFTTVTNGIHQGCALAYVDGNTVQVGKCILSVNGSFVKTTTTNNVTWGCSGCSSEVISTTYYVYAKSGSSGTTLNLLISTAAPGVDGYDGSSNKVIGKFFNNASSAIDQYSLYSWLTSGFSTTNGVVSSNSDGTQVDSIFFLYGDLAGSGVCASNPCDDVSQIGNNLTSVARTSTGTYTITFKKKYSKVFCVANPAPASNGAYAEPVHGSNTNTVTMYTFKVVDETTVDTYGTVNCKGY